jgi:hypothetical protein
MAGVAERPIPSVAIEGAERRQSMFAKYPMNKYRLIQSQLAASRLDAMGRAKSLQIIHFHFFM